MDFPVAPSEATTKTLAAVASSAFACFGVDAFRLAGFVVALVAFGEDFFEDLADVLEDAFVFGLDEDLSFEGFAAEFFFVFDSEEAFAEALDSAFDGDEAFVDFFLPAFDFFPSLLPADFDVLTPPVCQLGRAGVGAAESAATGADPKAPSRSPMACRSSRRRRALTRGAPSARRRPSPPRAGARHL